MEHEWLLAKLILIDVLGSESLRRVDVNLKRAALLVSGNRVSEHQLELGPIGVPSPGLTW
ncbi:hypothetical protein AB7M26_004083 [Pseudomonas sp. F-14 TE3482]